MKYFIFIILLFTFNQIEAKQKYYKWTDAEGNTHYTENKPSNQQTSEIKVSTHQPKISEPIVEETKSEEDVAELTDEQKETIEFNKKEKERVMKAQNKANCEIAKKNLATLQEASLVKRTNPATGELIRMDNSNKIQMMKKVKKSIKDLCN